MASPRNQVSWYTTGQSPAEVIGIPEEEIPEELLTNPQWAAEYHRLKGTRPTPSMEEFARRSAAGQPLQVTKGEVTEVAPPMQVEMGTPIFTPGYEMAQAKQELLRRRPTVRTSPTAPITAPLPYESLARYAPGGDADRQDALRYAAGRGANGSSPSAQMAALVMGGAAPTRAPGEETLTPTQQALKWAAQRSILAQAARIGGTAIGRGDAPGYAALERAAGEPLAALQMEQAQADRASALLRQQAMMDPTSPESRAVQELLGTLPGMKGTQVPAGQAELALKVAEARQKGMPSATDLAMMELRREALDLRREQGAAQLAEDRARRAENEAFREAAILGPRREHLAREAGERAVPGYGFAPGQFPSAVSAEKMRDALSRVGQIETSLGSMRDIWRRSGAELGWGAERATSQSDRQDILLNLKELQNLGVLQKVDVDTLEKVIPDPNTLRGAFLPGDIEAKFDTFERQLRSTIATRAAARGYVPQGGGAAPAPAAGGPPARVNSQADFDRLPSGASFIGPDGKRRRKP